MNKISLTDFIDVVTKSGASKATKVANIKNRPAYSPASDFYRGVREKIVEVLESGGSKAVLDDAVDAATIKRKEHYKEAVAGMKKWWGRKELECFEPSKGDYGNGNIAVNVNPELGVYVQGVPHLVKLYFKADTLPKNHAMISTHLMETSLSDTCPEGTVMSVLDVKRGRLHVYDAPHPKLDAALKGELAYIEALWDSV